MMAMGGVAWLPLCGLLLGADHDNANYDEALVPEYTLPATLVFADGTPLAGPADWPRRRAELLALLSREMFGQRPPEPEAVRATVFDDVPDALDGRARRRQVTIALGPGPDAPTMDLLLYLPAAATGPVPTFLGLNFRGNQAIWPDPAIKLSESWMGPRPEGVVNNRATEESRGVSAGRWPIDQITARGYGVATIYYGDIDPDHHDEFQNGIHRLWPELQGRGDNFASIAAWAWGLSRGLDYLLTLPEVDAQRVIVMGHSRLGKTSLWAGACDERFAMVISNNSGAGGAALSRRAYGETVARLNRVFPHWFCANFRQYNNNEAALPFDQHQLLALAAPRPLYVTSATEDRWADPRGEFLAAAAASEVYAFLGLPGLATQTMPPPDEPVHGGRVGYHLRTGKHDVTAYDWACWMDFADRHLR